MNKMYRRIDVWKRIDERKLVRYRCFEVLAEGRFCIQNADFINLPLDDRLIANLERSGLELFAECAPDERARTFASLAEAIADHEVEFGGSR